MPSFRYEGPVWLRLFDYDEYALEELRSELTYESAKVREELRRVKNATWMEAKLGREEWLAKQEELKEKLNVCLVEEDGKGFKVLSGFAARLIESGWTCENEPKRPEPGLIATQSEMRPPRYYQTIIKDKLIEARHACVSAATGTGKSWVIAKLALELGLRTVIMAPSKNIANQLYDDLVVIFGKKRVGIIGDGKRDYKKQIVVGIAGSLSNIAKKGEGPEFDHLSKAEVFIVDESHMTAAATFALVATELMISAWYRFFLSATQFRNDGSDILLEGLTGPEVYEYSLEQGIKDRVLAKPVYYIFDVGPSPRRSYSHDVMEMTRMHYYANPDLHKKAAQIINNFLDAGYTTMVLIEELQQFNLLYPHLTWTPAFAHACTDKEDLQKLPEKFRKPDVQELVRGFNAGKHKLLIGTSCIGTGTDTRPVQALLYMQGGRSEIQVSQARGRGTRIVPGKTEFIFGDFFVQTPGLEAKKDPLTRHLVARVEYYGGPGNVNLVPVR